MLKEAPSGNEAYRWGVIRSFVTRGWYGEPPSLRFSERVREYTNNKFIDYLEPKIECSPDSKSSDKCDHSTARHPKCTCRC